MGGRARPGGGPVLVVRSRDVVPYGRVGPVRMHADELDIDAALVTRLLKRERPDLAGLPVTPVGGGTDNVMFRVGDDDLAARLPRTVEKAASLQKERRWLPVLADRLPCEIPVPVHDGRPGEGYPAPWALVRWIEGADVSARTVTDWARYGRDLAEVVAALHGVELLGRRREGPLSWYRGGSLIDCDAWVTTSFAQARALDTGLDLDALERCWREGLALPPADGDHVWLHGDLRPGNVLVRDGRLVAVIDFGALSIGHPDAEHAAVWDLPAAARDAYRDRLTIDDQVWTRARAWAVAVGISGVTYYWGTFPTFVDECLARLRRLAPPS